MMALAPPSARAQSQNPLPAVPPPPPGLNPQETSQTSHTIKASVAMVVLHATVVDDKGQFVPGLAAPDFHVWEDKVPQQISVFSRDDIPVTMGLVIDNSASMREKRAQVNAAAMTFVKTSNPQDEDFVVNFNDESYLDINEDFTNDTQELNEALSRIDTRGSTALYDAIVSSLDHLKKGHKDKRVLLVITDGDDDASRLSFEDTIKAAEQSSAAIYAIGVFSQEDRKTDKKMVRHSKKTLTELAEATGGLAYFPDTLDQVEAICVQVARDIRNQYTIGYYPSNTTQDGTFRTIQLQVTGHHGMGKLSVRTRAGYYAPKAAKQ
ncbi:MAG: VWA domain-containing protein [Candidatus Acidiferrales bacterium]